MMKDLKWQPLHERRRDQRLTLMYKMVNGLVAIPADTLFTCNTRPSRNSHSKTIRVTTCNTEVYKNSYVPTTINDWNQLPEVGINSETLNQFKAALRKKLDFLFAAHSLNLEDFCSVPI